MSWISLAATRYRQRQLVSQAFAGTSYASSPLRVVSSLETLTALLAGDRTAFDSEARRAEPLIRRLAGERKAPSTDGMASVFGLAVVGSLLGDDSLAIIDRIARARSYRDAQDKALQLIARRIMGLEPEVEHPYRVLGHVETEAAWVELVRMAPTLHALRLATCPDHPQWPLLSDFVLPLALLAARKLKSATPAETLIDLVSNGGEPVKPSRTVVYERAFPLSAEDSTEAAHPKTERGFDAITLDNGMLTAYYWLGFRWKAPLVYEPALNSFDFLERVASDWEAVEASCPTDKRDGLRILRESGCRYTVVIDASESFSEPGDILAAAEAYGISLEVRDFTQV